MIPALRHPSRRRIGAMFPLLAIGALAAAQDAPEPLDLGHESATESHRRVDEPPVAAASTTPPAAAESVAAPADASPVPDTPPTPPSTSLGLAHDSVRADYVPFDASDTPDWIGANETVGEIGGWRAYARERFASTEPSDESDGAGTATAAAAVPATARGGGGDRQASVDTGAAPRSGARDAAADTVGPRWRAPVHESAFGNYSAYEASEGPNWIEANRVVGEIGGWRAYARERFASDDSEGDTGGGTR